MRELSMHILDLAQNSIAAGASRLDIRVAVDTAAGVLTISLRDNGRGMSPEMAQAARDPFVTSRTTRRVGLGIPMFAEAARSCGGSLEIDSRPDEGTLVVATFGLDSVDRAPLGDIEATLISLVAANPQMRLVYSQSVDDREFVLDTEEIHEQLDGVPISEGPVLGWIREYVAEGTAGVAVD